MQELIRTLIRLYCEKCRRQTVHDLIYEDDRVERYQCQICQSEQEFAVR
jgi:hypothetical protein